MGQKIELEGRLRIAGDGLEWDGLYLDNDDLMSLFCAYLKHKSERKWVGDPQQSHKPWEPVSKEERKPWSDAYVPFTQLQADFGKVKITIEQD